MRSLSVAVEQAGSEEDFARFREGAELMQLSKMTGVDMGVGVGAMTGNWMGVEVGAGIGAAERDDMDVVRCLEARLVFARWVGMFSSFGTCLAMQT